MVNRTARRTAAPLALAALAALAAACDGRTAAEREGAAIAARNAEARGGLAAWRRVKSMALSGQLEAGRPRDPMKLAAAYQRPRPKGAARKALPPPAEAAAGAPVRLPFAMELQRPRRSRVEVRFQGQTAVQVYDGERGWKVRPFLGRREVEPFTAEELRVSAQQADLDGPLLDWAAKGSRVALVGKEPVDGRDAFVLEVTPRRGPARRVWVDAETYLDVKVDGTRRLDGQPRTVWTTFRDFRPVDGLLVPHQLETAVEGAPGSEKLTVERVALNPKLDAARFARPD